MRPQARLTGSLALAGSALYLLSDAIEATQGGFSDGQLWLTLIAEALVPVFVIGLLVAQGSRLGPVGRAGAFAYAGIRDLAFAGMGAALLRPLYLQGGSSAAERRLALLGDELLPGADLTAIVLAATEPCER